MIFCSPLTRVLFVCLQLSLLSAFEYWIISLLSDGRWKFSSFLEMKRFTEIIRLFELSVSSCQRHADHNYYKLFALSRLSPAAGRHYFVRRTTGHFSRRTTGHFLKRGLVIFQNGRLVILSHGHHSVPREVQQLGEQLVLSNGFFMATTVFYVLIWRRIWLLK